MASGRQRHGVVEKRLGFRDHLGAARLVETFAGFARIMRDRVGAVEGIVEAAPARVGGVQRVARIGERHHELRPADLADLFIDIGGLDLLGRGFRQEIADLLEERGIGIHVERLALVGAMPAVDLCLQRIAHREQRRGSSAPRSRTIAASPAQKASGEIPVLGAASLAIKSNRTGAIFSPWASIRFIDKTLAKSGQSHAVFRVKRNKRRKGGVRAPF